jgi:hypothetical protein
MKNRNEYSHYEDECPYAIKDFFFLECNILINKALLINNYESA